MNKKIERRFPWLPYVYRKFLESSCGDYKIEALECLQQNITEAIQEVERKHDLKIAKLLLKGIKSLYYHFYRIWTSCNKVSPYPFKFTAHMKDAWVHILSSFIKMSMLLSQGRKKSKWINQALNVIARFKGEKNLIYDALLLVHKLNKKYQPAYGAILKSLLMSMPLFIPEIIDDPAEFLKVYLLARRLKLLLKDRAEKVELQMKVSRILAPSSLWDWLENNDFFVPWTRKGVKKVTLGVNILRKLCEVGNESQVEMVETLRKKLLPRLCTERKAEQRPHVINWCRKIEYVSAACSDQVTSEDDEEITTRINGVSAQVPSEYKDIEAIDRKNKRKIHVSVQCTKVKRKKLKRKRNKPLEDDEEGMNGSKSGMRKSVGKLKNVTKDVRRVKKRKNRKKQKSVHLEENLRYGTGQADLPSQGCSSEFAEYEEITTIDRKSKRKIRVSVPCTDQILSEDDKEEITVKKTKVQSKKLKRKRNKPQGDDEEEMNRSGSGMRKSVKKLECVDGSEENLFGSIDHTSAISTCDYGRLVTEKKNRKKQKSAHLEEKLQYETGQADLSSQGCSSEFAEYEEITTIDRKSKRKIRVSVPCTDQILSEDDKEEITVKKTKVQSKKLKRKRNKPQGDDEEEMNRSGSGMRKSVKKLECVDGSEENLFGSIDHTSAISTCDNGRLVTEKKNRKKQKSAHLEEKLQYETGQADLSSQGCSSEFAELATKKIKQWKQNLDMLAKKILNNPNQSIDKDSCLLKDSTEDMQQSAGGRRRPKMESKKKHQKCMSNSDSECEPKSKKRRQREKIVAEKISDNVNVTSCDHSLLEDISQTAKITKRKRQRAKESGSYSKETELIAIKSEFVAEDLPVVIDEIHDNKPVTNEREFLSKSRIVDYDSSSSDDDQPVISREVKYLKKFYLNSSPRKENKETELKSNPEVETKIMAEKIFIIDSEPSSCFSETGANQIAYDEICVAEQKDASSCEKPDNISNNEEDLNSSVTLTDLQAEDIPAESNSHLIPINTNNSFQEIVIKKEKLTSDSSSLPNKTTSEVISDCDSASSFEVDNIEVKKERDSTSIDIQSPPRNNSFCDQPKYEVTGLFFDVKSPISETEVSLHEDSERSSNHKILDDITAQNLDSEAKSSNVETPNICCAKIMIERVLSLAELEGFSKESVWQNINEGDLTSILNGLSVKNLSKLTSSAAHEKPAECSSFLDISAENVGSLQESQTFVCHIPESSEFMQCRNYRFLISRDQGDNRSEGTLSENKSILESDESEYPSDTSNDAEDEENNSSLRDCNSSDASNFKNNCETYVVKTECSWDDAITRQRFCQVDDDECGSRSSLDNQTNNYEPNVKMEYSWDNAITDQRFCKEESNKHDTRSSQDNQADIFAKSLQLKERLLNPVVNLEARCDSESFIDIDSTASADSLSIPTNSCVLSDIKAEDEEINETFQSNQTVDQLLTDLNETAKKIIAIAQSTSNSRKHETGKVNIDINMEIQPGHKDVKKLSLMADTELTVSGEVQETVELKSEKELSQDNKATGYDKGPQLSTCDSDQLSIKPKREKELSQDHETAESLKLRKRPVAAVQTEEPVPADENSSDLPAAQQINLRSRNPSSSSQGKSASADEDSSVFSRDTPATRCMNLRGRNPSSTSTQEVMKRRSQTVSKRSSKRLKSQVNLNLGPKTRRSKLKSSSNENSSEVVEDKSPTSDQGNSCRRLTRASVISSTVDTRIKEQDINPDGYNLRSRKSVIMPLNLKL